MTPPTDVEDKNTEKAKDEDEEDEDDFDNLLTPTKKLKARKLTNFRSMLADSHMNAICLHPERALARKKALALAQAQTVSAPPIMNVKRAFGKGGKLSAPNSFSPSPSPAPRMRLRYEFYEDERSESLGSEFGGDYDGGDDDGRGIVGEDEDDDEELDRIRGRVSIGQESMSSDDVLDLFAYDDSV